MAGRVLGDVGEMTLTGNINFGDVPEGGYVSVEGAIGYGFPAGALARGIRNSVDSSSTLGLGMGLLHTSAAHLSAREDTFTSFQDRNDTRLANNSGSAFQVRAHALASQPND